MAGELAHALTQELNTYLLSFDYVLSIMLGAELSDETDLFPIFNKSTVWSAEPTRSNFNSER